LSLLGSERLGRTHKCFTTCNSSHNIFWESDAALSVSVNLSGEFSNFVVELSLLVKIVDKLFNTKCQFNARNTIIDSFHYCECLVKVFCGACNSSNSSFDWNCLFKSDGRSSFNYWCGIFANVLSNIDNIMDNDLSFLPELFPECLALLLSSSEFTSDSND